MIIENADDSLFFYFVRICNESIYLIIIPLGNGINSLAPLVSVQSLYQYVTSKHLGACHCAYDFYTLDRTQSVCGKKEMGFPCLVRAEKDKQKWVFFAREDVWVGNLRSWNMDGGWWSDNDQCRCIHVMRVNTPNCEYYKCSSCSRESRLR